MLTGETFNPLTYAWPVEAGRKPGKMPPSDSEGLLLWVQRKLGLTGTAARSAAYLIARKIGQVGTKGAFMLREGWNEAEPLIIKIHEAIPAKVLDKLAR